MEAAEREVADAEARLADPTLYAKRGHEVAALERRLHDARAAVTTLVARWEALETKKGGA
ncbi:MAG TPA: hypothetical protein VE987_02925 [Polyangiaceae bacterium]|nr:hypothetical protein [Polyangiaceae bacterium]